MHTVLWWPVQWSFMAFLVTWNKYMMTLPYVHNPYCTYYLIQNTELQTPPGINSHGNHGHFRSHSWPMVISTQYMYALQCTTCTCTHVCCSQNYSYADGDDMHINVCVCVCVCACVCVCVFTVDCSVLRDRIFMETSRSHHWSFLIRSGIWGFYFFLFTLINCRHVHSETVQTEISLN